MFKKLPIGIENFKEFKTDGFYYVDKTLMIKYFIANRGKVNLFTRPRRFGKTLTMSMLQSFFEIGTDPSLFEGLEIAKEEEICKEYMGKYPVISISLKSVDGLNFDSAMSALRAVIGFEASRFSFLKDSTVLSDEEKDWYCQLIKVGSDQDGIYSMSHGTMLLSLKTLSNLLFKHFGRKPIILIDEYDVPLDKAYSRGYYEEMVITIRSFFSNALKTNNDFFFAVLTGCLRVSKESIFTGLNNLKVYSLSDVRSGEYFGFTEKEVNDLLSFYSLSSHRDVIKRWYDGFLFGKESVYCPWDVINYVDLLLYDPDAPPENYWANTSSNDIILKLLEISDQGTRKDVEALLNDETIVRHVSEELTYKDIGSSASNIWSVLYVTGYLTRASEKKEKEAELKIPNLEIKDLFSELVKEWFFNNAKKDNSRINKFCTSFLASDVKTLQKMLQYFLWNSISIRDSGRESFYHGMLLGLIQSQQDWRVKSNSESGEGYSDILIETLDRIGVVIEIKYAHDGNLEKSAKEALLQIEEKQYAKELEMDGMKTIRKYGIAFYKKECFVAPGK